MRRHQRDHGKDDDRGGDVVEEEDEHAGGRRVHVLQPEGVSSREFQNTRVDISPRKKRAPATIWPCMQIQAMKMTMMAKKITSQW